MRIDRLLVVLAIAPLSGCSLFGVTSKVKVEHPTELLDSGANYREIVAGEGARVELGQEVSIDYIGFLSDGTIFDSSIDRGIPEEFVLGEAPLPGWNSGILGMQAGGQRHLYVPPHLAYGEAGIKGMVPPNEPLAFEIWLLEIR